MTLQLKTKDIPVIKEKLLKKQKGLCLICKRDLYSLPSRERHLHHNHTTWKVVGVLCARCNRCEGKILSSYTRFTKKEVNSKQDYLNVLKGLVALQSKKETNYNYPPKKRRGKKHGKTTKNSKTRTNKTTS